MIVIVISGRTIVVVIVMLLLLLLVLFHMSLSPCYLCFGGVSVAELLALLVLDV